MANTPLLSHHTHAAGRQRGVGLIEVLIAVLILSFGLVGLSLLQGRVLKYTYSSMQRTEALTLLNSLMESMRANRAEAVSGLYNVVGVQAAPGGASQNPRTGRSGCHFDRIPAAGRFVAVCNHPPCGPTATAQTGVFGHHSAPRTPCSAAAGSP